MDPTIDDPRCDPTIDDPTIDEAYDRRSWPQASGLDLTSLIAAVCRHLEIAERELEISTRRVEIARARDLTGYIVTQELGVPGSEVTRRFHIDGAAVNSADRHAAGDSELIEAAEAVLGMLK